jgi:hypothetical protein
MPIEAKVGTLATPATGYRYFFAGGALFAGFSSCGRRARACALRRLRFSRKAVRKRCWRSAGGLLRLLTAARLRAIGPCGNPSARCAAVAQW